MPRVSVIMSTYNESQDQINLAINSILNQTYSDFELIIINDNPADNTLFNYLCLLANNDSRVRLFNNEKNIGLAMTMNKAAKLAKGIYIARMDADDISFPERLEKEVAILDTGLYDFVFTNYRYINEYGSIIEDLNGSPLYSDSSIGQSLIEDNIIHHPTVMFTKTLFEKVAGYRDFPCAQDYDLWLRMLHKNCRFHMLPEVLLYYRIRCNSVTEKKRLQQKYTMDYARILFLERISSNDDSYSVENYKMYVNKRNAMYKKPDKQLITSRNLLIKASNYRKDNNTIAYIICRALVFIKSPLYRDSFIIKIKTKYYARYYKK